MRGISTALHCGIFCAGIAVTSAIIFDCRNGALMRSSYLIRYLDIMNQRNTWQGVAPVWFCTLLLVGVVELICTALLLLLNEPNKEGRLQRNEGSCATSAFDQEPFKEASVAIATFSAQDQIVETQNSASVIQPDVQTAATSDTIERGDVVRLHACQGIPSDFWNRCAVVKGVHAQHCNVVVLDNESRYCLGESWPNLCDVTHMRKSWRLGSKVWVRGMFGSKTRNLENASGTIVEDQRQGHLCFIKTRSSSCPVLALCVCLDQPRGKYLLDARFLIGQSDFVDGIIQSLEQLREERAAPEAYTTC